MILKDLLKSIERVFPKEWALEGDPVGLLLGDPEQEVHNAMAALEVSSDLLKQIKRKNVEFLFVHHPLLFHPLKRVLENDPVQRLVRELIRNDIALYAAHTNVDLHPQGMAKTWASKLGCKKAEPLAAKPQAGQLKLATFVPAENANQVREALSAAGAGIIGEYDLCSYNLEGYGTFRGSEQSDPYLGQAGQLETEAETRVEMVLPQGKKQQVVKALWEVHPYEEPAYDLYPMEDVKGLEQALWIAEFEKAISWKQFEERVQNSVVSYAAITNNRFIPKKKIKKIAISTGSGSRFIQMACGLEVDAYLTGEAGYHLLWEAKEAKLPVITAGHDASELFFAETVIPLLQPFTSDVNWLAEKL